MTEDVNFRVKSRKLIAVEWEIKRFFYLPKTFRLNSPRFTFCNAEWFIIIWPTKWRTGWIAVYLVKDSSLFPFRITFTIGLKRANGSLFKACDGYSFETQRKVWSFDKFIQKSLLQTGGFINDPDASLKIFCVVRMVEDLPTALETSLQTSQRPYLLEINDCKRKMTKLKEKFAVACKEKDDCKKEIKELKEKIAVERKVKDDCRREITELKEKLADLNKDKETSAMNFQSVKRDVKQDSALAENLRELLSSRYEGDTTVRVGDKEFLVHKAILAARSSVFHTMFETDMTEKKDGIINVEDCEPGHFENFLLFIYSGQFDIVRPSNALKLCLIADKYNVLQLKEACFEVMKNEMSAESVIDALYLATLYNKRELLNAATSYFIENMGKVVITQKWISFLTEHPTIANELFVKMAENNAK